MRDQELNSHKSADAPSLNIMQKLPLKELCIFWLILSVTYIILSWPRLDESFQSPDNAMRLVQIRAFLNGAPWFNPFEARLNPPEGYITHWSRLIDAPIAGLILFFNFFSSAEFSEKLARALWPLLLAFPALIATCLITLRIAGQHAVKAGLIVALGALAASPVFRPGEIDHHNAQLVCVLIMIAGVIWLDQSRIAALMTGITGATLLAIGLEYAYAFAVIFGALTLMALLNQQWRRGAVTAFAALGIIILFLWLTVTPSLMRLSPLCDALSINIALPVALVGISLAILFYAGHRLNNGMRWSAVLLIGVCASALFVSFEPRCIQGPYGTLDPRLFEIWLNDVDEVQSIVQLLKTRPVEALSSLIFPVTVIIGLIIRRQSLIPAWGMTHFPLKLMIILFMIAVIGLMFQVRIEALALWLGVPLAAALIHDTLKEHPHAGTRYVIGALILNPILLIGLMGAIGSFIQSALSPTKSMCENMAQALSCTHPRHYEGLAELSLGTLIGPRDLGGSFLLHTPHQVISAPYHRIGRAILFTSDVMRASPEQAILKLKEANIDYVVECKGYLSLVTDADQNQNTLRMALLNNRPVSGLEPINVQSEALSVWKIH